MPAISVALRPPVVPARFPDAVRVPAGSAGIRMWNARRHVHKLLPITVLRILVVLVKAVLKAQAVMVLLRSIRFARVRRA